MATTIDWPSAPTVGQTYLFTPSGRQWIWNGTGWARVISGGGGFGLTPTLLMGPFIEVGGLFAVPQWFQLPTLLTHT